MGKQQPLDPDKRIARIEEQLVEIEARVEELEQAFDEVREEMGLGTDDDKDD